MFCKFHATRATDWDIVRRTAERRSLRHRGIHQYYRNIDAWNKNKLAVPVVQSSSQSHEKCNRFSIIDFPVDFHNLPFTRFK